MKLCTLRFSPDLALSCGVLSALLACGGPQQPADPAVGGAAHAEAPTNFELVEPAPEGEPQTAPDERPVFRIRTPQEFIEHLGSDRVLEIEAEQIALHDLWPSASPYASSGRPPQPPPTTDVVFWENPYDGWELEVRGVQNLKIVGTHPAKPELLTSPRGSWVIRFTQSSHLALENLTVGHTEEGYCLGGVLMFENTRDVSVQNCDLFGSGTIGVHLSAVNGFHMVDSQIRDCSYGIAEIEGTEDATFENVTFRRNQEFTLFSVDGASAVELLSCRFLENRTGRPNYPLFAVDAGGRLQVSDSEFRSNQVSTFATGQVGLTRCSFDNNGFADP